MSIKIAIFSDWHLGLTKDRPIQKAFAAMAKCQPDIVICAGDYNGGRYGAKALRTILQRQREALPDTPSVSVIGNHDLWQQGKPIRSGDRFDLVGMSTKRNLYPSQDAWNYNYQSIIEHFKTFKVHFLDEEGVYRNSKFPGLAILGHTMWYQNPYPPTNDSIYMPVGVEGDTHAFLLKKGYQSVYDQVDSLKPSDNKRIFVSHFPVIKTASCRDFETWSGSEAFGEYIRTLGVEKFINGHAHQFHEGPLRYESGSDYGKPKFLIVEV